ncbi:MAG: NAD-dependent epimerase/dehydratase family protein [Acidothermaceae bacterium]
MRVFVAGATGVIGRPLVRQLVAAGHDVAGMTRSASKVDVVRELGGEPVVCDVYDADALTRAVAAWRPDAIVHELTDLPDDAGRLGDFRDANARIRRIGTRNLIAAAQAAAVTRFVAQSVAWQLPGDGGAAVEEHEQAVLAVGGVVARYGMFYGPGTYHEDDRPDAPRVHVDDAARRTVPLLDAPSGIVVIADE